MPAQDCPVSFGGFGRGRLGERIACRCPLRVDVFTGLALWDETEGYYHRISAPNGSGDFLTAPEASQMFGEMLGLWVLDWWRRCGRPSRVVLVEAGPGSGRLLEDFLRAARTDRDFFRSLQVHLIESSASFRSMQREVLGDFSPCWHHAFSSIPQTGPLVLIANEFFDTLPIRQFVHVEGIWRERYVDVCPDTQRFFFAAGPPSPLPCRMAPTLAAQAAENDLMELCPAGVSLMCTLAQSLRERPGIALVVDYGRSVSGFGASLQGISRHRIVSPLSRPGRTDISAHVDFPMLATTARNAGVNVPTLCTQSVFLRFLGIEERFRQLVTRAPQKEAFLRCGLQRLLDNDKMGRLFQTLGLFSPLGAAPLWPDDVSCA